MPPGDADRVAVAGRCEVVATYLFRAVHIPDLVRPTMIMPEGFRWNYTAVLNIVALIGFAALYRLYRHSSSREDDTTGTQRYATDPVSGLKVEKVHAPATATVDGTRYWFCSDHCRSRFRATPDPGQRQDAHAEHQSIAHDTGYHQANIG